LTIITSGSILIIATLIIGIVSQVKIISDLGFLLSKGCTISVLIVLLALPQFLMLCDKLIEKTTYKTKFFDDSIKAEVKEVESSDEIETKKIENNEVVEQSEDNNSNEELEKEDNKEVE
ncbi:MAG: hypothetical protein J6X02_01530, partial [Bacilli bacterium]|nr:hypothetical protein [Bacilli bacterium]